ncbi:MAG TPA: response regulator [Bryobacteraceae bacterium]|nr:response regulator [Bryobacteraceae bacterium]
MAYSVLIVDDSQSMRKFVRRVMDLSGFEVGSCWDAANGAEALALLRTHPVDIILTDINMPEMNGEELVAELERQDAYRAIPVVVVSTDATENRIRRMIEIGARGYVVKPFSPEALRGELERVLGVAHD